MVSKSTGFAKYSKNLNWLVAVIMLVLAVLSFTGDSPDGGVIGVLWLALAIAFGSSAMFLGGDSAPDSNPGAAE